MVLVVSKDLVVFERVRDFRPAVQDAVVTLGRMAHSESGHRHLSLDLDYLLENSERFTRMASKAFWLAWEGDRPVGVFAGIVHDYYFSRDLIAEDSLWYVVPDKRGTRVGLQLLELFEEWADGQDVVDVRVGQTSNLDPRVFNGVLGRTGYDNVGSYFVRSTRSDV